MADATDTGFPPSAPALTKTIPSYLYWQYRDDDDVRSFVNAYNDLAQQYLDYINGLNLPVYTNSAIFGDLLDWVAFGIYGFRRPVLPFGSNKNLGPLNTYRLNTMPLNTIRKIGPSQFFLTTDDIFKRILTWAILKGDGRIFDVRWLKRRIMRFLIGDNGSNPNIDETYQISVTFGNDNQVNINILSGVRKVTGGAFPNRMQLNAKRLNQLDTVFVSYPAFELAPVFKAAVESGVLELPFQFDWVVNI